MQKQKMNLKIRFKNPVFIISLILAILTPIMGYVGIQLEDLTTWKAIGDLLVEAVSNPYCLGLVLVSVYNAVIDPTTKGLGDSDRVLDKTEL